jgi:UPF0176 protein
MSQLQTEIVVAALYRFARLENPVHWREPLLSSMRENGVRGTLLLASEGINGTIAGPQAGIDMVLARVLAMPNFGSLEVKFSYCNEMPFRRTRVRMKKEIVTLGVPGIDPNQSVGTYVEPEQWNDLINDPDVVVVDTRNEYEVAIGAFSGALNPHTESFREFPGFVDEHLDPNVHKRVAMYCTGGIRCEKSTALLKQRGFQEVYHLRGGILKYLECIPEERSMFEGECFVFDKRVSVKHGLTVGDRVMCYGCGWPVSQEEQQHPDYVAGVQCKHCAGELTDDQKRRFAERQRQLSQLRSTETE